MRLMTYGSLSLEVIVFLLSKSFDIKYRKTPTFSFFSFKKGTKVDFLTFSQFLFRKISQESFLPVSALEINGYKFKLK